MPSPAARSRLTSARAAGARGACALAALAACGENATSAGEASAPLTVTPAAVTCRVGERVRLAASPAPARRVRYEFVTSGDVVRVTPDAARGEATVGCAAVGGARVTVSDGRQSVDVPVDVAASPGAVLAVDVQPASLDLVLGSEWRLAARARVRDTLASPAVRFASLDTAVAVVDAAGLVRAVALGTTTLVAAAAADPSVQATVTVNVPRRTAVVQSIFVEPSITFVTVGDSVRLRPVVSLAPGAPAGSSRDAIFSTADTALVSVTPAGLVRARRAGVARVVASPVSAPALRFTAFVSVREPLP